MVPIGSNPDSREKENANWATNCNDKLDDNTISGAVVHTGVLTVSKENTRSANRLREAVNALIVNGACTPVIVGVPNNKPALVIVMPTGKTPETRA